MNSILENNFLALSEFYPEMIKKIKNYRKLDPKIIIQSIKSWDDEIIFRVKKDDKLLYLNGKRNVQKPLELWYERYNDINEYATVFLLGIGSGIYLKKIIENTQKTVNIVAYEPSIEIFLALLSNVDLSEIIKNRMVFFIIDGINQDDFEYAINKLITIETLEYLKVDIHPNYRELFLEDILDKIKRINKRTDFLIVNEKTGVSFSTVSARNQLINMQYVIDGYNTKQLVQVIPYKDRAAILVSAGPSLNKNIENLKEAKNHIFILAVDTAVKPLLNAGVVPDAMITIDGMKPLKLIEIEGADEIPIISSVTANCEFIGHQKGKKFLYFDGHMLPQEAYMSVGKFLPQVHTGGSVACTGFALLYMLGFNTIILVGQDLAFTDNKSHADGTFEEKMPEEDTSQMIMVKGNYEDEVPTRGDFKYYLDWFDEFIEGIQKRRSTRVINATEGGAFIKGTEIMTLKNAIAQNTASYINFEECIGSIQSEFTEEEKIKIIKYILDIPKELLSLKKKLQELIIMYEKIQILAKKNSSSKVLKILRKIDKYTKEIERNKLDQLIRSTLSYAEWIVRSESLAKTDDIEKELEQIVKQGVKLARLKIESVDLLDECANELIEDIKEKYTDLYTKSQVI